MYQKPQKTTVEIWLYENTTTKLQGRIIVSVSLYHVLRLDSQRISAQGFDEYMNVVLDNAEEVDTKKKSTVQLGASNLSPEPDTACGQDTSFSCRPNFAEG